MRIGTLKTGPDAGKPSKPYVAFCFPGETKIRPMSLSKPLQLAVKAGDLLNGVDYQIAACELNKGQLNNGEIVTEDSVYYFVARIGEQIVMG